MYLGLYPLAETSTYPPYNVFGRLSERKSPKIIGSQLFRVSNLQACPLLIEDGILLLAEIKL